MPGKLRPWRSFRGKLYAVFAILIILGSTLGVVGYLQLTQVERISANLVGTSGAHSLAEDLAAGLDYLEFDLDDYLVVGDEAIRSAVETDLSDIVSTLAKLEEQVLTDESLGPDLKMAIAETASLRAHVDKLLGDQTMDVGARTSMVADIDTHLNAVRGLYDEFNEASLAGVNASIVSQTGIVSALSVQLLVVGALIMAILLATSLYVGRSVRSIGKVTDAALAVAGGDLDREVPMLRRDEIGLLAGAFNSMTEQLSELIDDLEHRVEERTAQLSTVNETLQDEITERVRAEDELRQSKDFAETVLNSMPESIAIIDTTDFTILGANKVFIDSAGVASAEELAGLTCYAVTHGRCDPCSPPDDICPLTELKAGHTVASAEHVHRDASGKEHHAEVSIAAIPDASGKITRVVHMSRDITERKAAENALRDYADRLEAALQDLGQAQAQLLQSQKLEAIGGLAAGVAHEVNTPIQYVGDNTRFLQEAFTDLMSLQKQVDDLLRPHTYLLDAETKAAYEVALKNADVDFLVDEVPSAIEETIDGVNRIAEIVRALKEFSHPGGDEKSPIDLNRLVDNTVTVSKNEWKQVAEVVTILEPDIPPISAMAGPLGQALLVLIVNAAQAIGGAVGDGSEEPGTITITTSTDETSAEITVADTGPGIADEIKDKVFEHFFTTKEVGIGSGQGLAIAHSIVVEQHGGEIDFASTVGEGTTFRICIPKESSAESEAA